MSKEKTKVEGTLRFVKLLPTKPPFMMKDFVETNYSTAQKLGLRYEQKVYKEILKENCTAVFQPWFEYSDDSGKSWCSPDIYFTLGGTIYIVECKLKYKKRAITKLKKLYRPLFQRFFPDHKIKMIQCFKNFEFGTKLKPVFTLDEVFRNKRKQYHDLCWRL